MDRRRFLLTSLAGALTPLAAQAQQPTKVPRVEGRTITIDWRFAEGLPARLPTLAAELVRLRVNPLFAEATPSAVAAQQATTTIPIVFSPVADPIGSGLVGSLARPGGNITGLTFMAQRPPS
jgi:putative ABC transport system substrate-binding protein